MAKRFTDSRKYSDPWFRKLTPLYKCFWEYLLNTCDHAGIWKIDFELSSFCIGEKIEESAAIAFFGKRIVVLSSEKWFIPKFIEFQYGDLQENNRVHQSVISILKKEGAYKGRNSTLLGCKDKDKDKDKDKNKDKDKDNNKELEKSPYSIFEYTILKMWNKVAEKNERLSKVRAITPSRRKHLKERFKNKDFVTHFNVVLIETQKSDFLMGGNDRKWCVDLDFLIKNDDNYQKILEGKYITKTTEAERKKELTKKFDIALQGTRRAL